MMNSAAQRAVGDRQGGAWPLDLLPRTELQRTCPEGGSSPLMPGLQEKTNRSMAGGGAQTPAVVAAADDATLVVLVAGRRLRTAIAGGEGSAALRIARRSQEGG